MYTGLEPPVDDPSHLHLLNLVSDTPTRAWDDGIPTRTQESGL
jgi:hypothetical protein